MNQLRDRFINFLNSRPYRVFAVACFITLLMVLAQPGYRVFKKIRSASVLETSKRLVEEESYVQAFYKARTAVLLDPGNLDAGRHLATLALKFGHPQAHRFWETVIRNEEALPSDWAFAVDASFRQGDYATAFEYLLRWQDAGVADPAEFELRQARAYALAGQLRIARQYIELAAQKYPQHEAIHIFYLQLFNMLASETERKQLAEKFIANPDTPENDLKWLAFNSLIATPQRLAALLATLERNEHTLAEELDLLNLAAKLGWDEANDRITAIGARIDPSNTEELAAYTSALCLVGRYSEVLEYLNEERANEDRILMRNLLLAQVKEGGIEETLDMTSQHRTKRLTSFAEETLLRALAFQETGNQGLYETNIDRAIDSAKFEDLAFLEYQFKRLGETRALLDLYKRISSHPRYGAQAHAFWLNLASSLKSESEISKIVNDQADWLTELLDPRQRANAIYYTLLLGDDKNLARHESETLAANFREDPLFQFLAAFAYYQAGLQSEARQFTAGFLDHIDSLDPRSQYIAALIHHNPAPSSLPFLKQLLPSERKLLAQAAQKTIPGASP